MQAHAGASPTSSPDSVSHHRLARLRPRPPRRTKRLTCGNAEEHHVPLRPPARAAGALAPRRVDRAPTVGDRCHARVRDGRRRRRAAPPAGEVGPPVRRVPAAGIPSRRATRVDRVTTITRNRPGSRPTIRGSLSGVVDASLLSGDRVALPRVRHARPAQDPRDRPARHAGHLGQLVGPTAQLGPGSERRSDPPILDESRYAA